MPSIEEWPDVLASATSAALSVLDHRFPVYPYPPARPEVTPCAIVQQGGSSGPFIEWGEGELTTLGQATARFSLWIVTGNPLTENAGRLFARLVTFLHGQDFVDVCRADPANPGGFVPAIDAIGTPGSSELGGVPVWWADVELLCPVRL